MDQWYCIVDGQQYGPVSKDVLEQWVQQGRIKPQDLVWMQGMDSWAQAGQALGVSGAPLPAFENLRPHRGGAVLALGILGLAICIICGIIAWVMGRNDLKEMDAGIMDSSGRGLTQAGKICGMISVILACAGAVMWLLWMIVIFGMGVSSM